MPLTSIAGNQSLKEQLLPRLSQGTLGHAFILSGPAGSGKHALASVLSRSMVCGSEGAKPCGSCTACKKALAGIHPDIVSVAPVEEGKAISVDQVRQMRADAYIRPNEARRKVYVLEHTQRMNDSAQNAMLKLLEEGPAYSSFLLLTDNPGSLLTTVRSRCEMLSLLPAGEQQQGDQELVQQARTLARLWLDADETSLMEQCVQMEKWERQKVLALFDAMSDYLCTLLVDRADQRRALKGAQLLNQLRQAIGRNVQQTSLLGWLCAAAAE